MTVLSLALTDDFEQCTHQHSGQCEDYPDMIPQYWPAAVHTLDYQMNLWQPDTLDPLLQYTTGSSG